MGLLDDLTSVSSVFSVVKNQEPNDAESAPVCLCEADVAGDQ